MFAPDTRSVALVFLWGCGGAQALERADEDGSIEWTVSALACKNDKAAIAATRELARLGPAARSAIPGLLRAVASGRTELTRPAIQALGAIGPGATDALLGLAAPLARTDRENRVTLVEALAGLGTDTVELVAALEAFLRDPEWRVRRIAAVALARMGHADSVVVGLANPVETTREDTIRMVREIDPQSVTAILPYLRNERPEVRSAAALALAELKGGAAAAAPAVAALLADSAPAARAAGALALGEMGNTATEQLPALLRALQMSTCPDPQDHGEHNTTEDPDEVDAVFCSIAADAAVTLARECGSCVAQLEALSVHPKAFVAVTAIVALGATGSAHAVPRLLAALEGPDPGLRGAAVIALGRIGPDADAAVPIMARRLQSNADGEVRDITAALAGIGSPRAVEVLAQASQAKPRDSEDIFEALGGVGEAAGPAVGVLEVAVARGSPAAMRALRAIAPSAATAALPRALNDSTLPISLRRVAANELAELGPRSQAALHELTVALKAEIALGASPGRREFRDSLTWALSRNGPPAIAALVLTLGASDEELRLAGVRGIGAIKPASSVEAEALGRALRDPSSHVRRSAASELRRFGLLGVPALVQALGADGGSEASDELLQMGDVPVPALLAVVNHRTSATPRAVSILGSIGAPARSAVPNLAALLAPGTDSTLLAAARDALSSIGNASAAPAFIAVLRSGLPSEARRTMPAAMARLCPVTEPVVSALAFALTDQDAAVAESAADALDWLGPPAASALPVLRTTLRRADLGLYLEWSVVEAISSIGGTDALADVVSSRRDSTRVRCAAARGLARAGAGARGAIPALEALASSCPSEVEEALRRIRASQPVSVP